MTVRATAEPEREGAMRLADGRTIAFSEWGDPTARPVLLLHGMPGSRLCCPDLQATRAAGARLITIDRPGYGRSDPRPWDRPLQDWTADFEALAAGLRLPPCPIVGWSSGGPYALAAARFAPERVAAIALVASDASIRQVPGRLAEMAPEARRLADLLESDREAALEGIRARVAWYAAEPTRILDQLADAHDADAAVRARPDVAATMRMWFREGARQGVEGFVGDWVATARPWGFGPSEVGCPVSIWWGEADPLTSRADTEYLIQTIPQAKAMILPGEGHSLAFTRWAEILAALG